MNLFNQQQLIQHRNNAAKNFNQFNFLKQELSTLLLERLNHVKGNFPLALDLMCHSGDTSYQLQEFNNVGKVISVDIASEMLKQCNNPLKIKVDPINLPFANNTFNLVVSVFGLHSLNNLPLIFKNIYNILQKDGLILLSIPCYGNLNNLSAALFNAEVATSNTTSARIHPFMDIKTLGNLIAEAGFTSIITNKEKIELMYKSINNIFKDLRGTGEHNILCNKSSNLLDLAFLAKFKQIMQESIDKESQHYPINVEVCNIMAWKA